MAKTKTKAQDTAVDFDELDVDPAEMEDVEVAGDVDSWIADMLAGPSEDDYWV